MSIVKQRKVLVALAMLFPGLEEVSNQKSQNKLQFQSLAFKWTINLSINFSD